MIRHGCHSHFIPLQPMLWWLLSQRASLPLPFNWHRIRNKKLECTLSTVVYISNTSSWQISHDKSHFGLFYDPLVMSGLNQESFCLHTTAFKHGQGKIESKIIISAFCSMLLHLPPVLMTAS